MAKRSIAALLSIVFTLAMLSAFAVIGVNAESSKELRLICEEGTTQVENMHWSLYRIGERSEGTYVLTGQFAAVPVKLSELSEDNINETAKALESFAISRSLEAEMTGDTDAYGTVVFSPLGTGLYLAVPEYVIKGTVMYSADPLIAEITDSSETMLPKIYKSIVAGSGVISATVKKVWLDSDNAAGVRPDSVTVDLYKDNEKFDTVKLDESNGWKHKWSGLDNRYRWRVAERDVPQGYTVLIDYNSKQFLIKNTLTDGTVTTVTTTAQSTTTASVTTSIPADLPQTGQPWTPVFALSLGGVVFIAAGLLLRHRTDKDEE